MSVSRDEWTAETVEEAVARALAELGLPRERVDVEVLEEPSAAGLFGFARRPARVRVRARPGFGEAARDFLRAVVDFIGLPAAVREPEATERGYLVRVEGDGAAELIGRHGHTLDALQQLAEVYATRRSGERAALLVDANGYRERRAAHLERLARRAARQVARDGRERRLEAMTPYERRIVHLALQGYPGVYTESEGEDPFRRVVIRPVKGEAAEADDVG